MNKRNLLFIGHPSLLTEILIEVLESEGFRVIASPDIKDAMNLIPKLESPSIAVAALSSGTGSLACGYQGLALLKDIDVPAKVLISPENNLIEYFHDDGVVQSGFNLENLLSTLKHFETGGARSAQL